MIAEPSLETNHLPLCFSASPEVQKRHSRKFRLVQHSYDPHFPECDLNEAAMRRTLGREAERAAVALS